MSGAFFGVWQAQEPVQRADMEAMDSALTHWGPDAHGMHLQGPLGLGARLLRVTPEDQHEVLPLIDGPHCLVARVRLDNRGDLCSRLGLVNTHEWPDSRLILAAYRQYGQDCVQYLVGDWSFALWDETTQTLLVARDASGNTGLCYCWDGRQLAFANGLQGILALPGFVAELEPLALAGGLTLFADPTTPDATLYKGVKKLLPGCLLLAGKAGVQQRRWWQPEALEPRRGQNVEDCYEEFVALYDAVVGECLRVGRGTVATTLSGGLDSGSVLALAAPRLKARSQMLTAFVHAPLYEPTLAGGNRTGDELALARLTADHVGNTRVVPVRSEGKTLLGGVQQALEVHTVPGHAASHYYWLFDIQQQARKEGARVLLTGQMGNATVSYGGHGGVWRAVRRRIVKPMIASVLSQWRRRREGDAHPWAAYSYIQPDFAAQLQLRERMREVDFDPTFSTYVDPGGAAMRQFRLGLSAGDSGGMAWMESGAAHGLDVRDPTRDRRLVEFCWRTPDPAFWAQGIRRGLIRQGMRARLPDPVLFCEKKGLQSADALVRFQRESLQMLDLLEGALAQGLSQWLDVGRMRCDLMQLAAGQDMDAVALHGLGRAVQVALFLRQKV